MAWIAKSKNFGSFSIPSLGKYARPSYCSVAAAGANDESSDDTVAELLTMGDRILGLMKMERRFESNGFVGPWFPYLDLYRIGSTSLSCREVIEVLEPHILNAWKERIRRVVHNRSYSVSLVVEGLTYFGNVSAAFRSADALGIQLVHVISSDRKRCSRN